MPVNEGFHESAIEIILAMDARQIVSYFTAYQTLVTIHVHNSKLHSNKYKLVVIRGVRFNQDNMSVYCIPPYTPHLYSKTGVYRGIHFFLFLS